jgi:hypothetical protein
MNVAINLPSTDNEARTDSPGGQFWSLCPANDRGSTPRYDPEASWHDFDQSKWDQPGRPLRPKVTISRAHAGDDFLADTVRSIKAI